jgi:hypothetical protein
MAKIANAITISEIEQILYAKNPHYEARFWNAEGVECRRDRHRYSGQAYVFTIEVLQLRFAQPGRSAWEVFIVNERWIAAAPETLIRGTKWLKLVSGKSSDVRDRIRRCRPLLAA